MPKKDGVDRPEWYQQSWSGEDSVVRPGGKSWKDNIKLPEAGDYTLRLVICFDGFEACTTGGGTFHSLSGEVPVTIRSWCTTFAWSLITANHQILNEVTLKLSHFVRAFYLHLSPQSQIKHQSSIICGNKSDLCDICHVKQWWSSLVANAYFVDDQGILDNSLLTK